MKNITIFLIVILLSGCKKNLTELPYQKINTPVSSTFRDLEVLANGTIFVCGGEDDSGFILYSTDSGVSWNYSGSIFDNSINAIHFISSDTGFAADSDILIYRTTNAGNSWEPFYATSWPLTVNRYLRDIWFSTDSIGFVCGGKNFGNGVLFKTNNKGDAWTFSEFNHELRGVCFSDSENGIICGYGTLMRTTNGGINFTLKDANNKFYTSICTDQTGNFWMCDFDGGIYKSENKGDSWIKIRKSSSWSINEHQLNAIAVATSGKIVVTGTNGIISWSTDGGNSWQDKISFDGKDVLQIKWLSENQAIACGKDGGLYRVYL